MKHKTKRAILQSINPDQPPPDWQIWTTRAALALLFIALAVHFLTQ